MQCYSCAPKHSLRYTSMQVDDGSIEQTGFDSEAFQCINDRASFPTTSDARLTF